MGRQEHFCCVGFVQVHNVPPLDMLLQIVASHVVFCINADLILPYLL